jgi:hypothetical protein
MSVELLRTFEDPFYSMSTTLDGSDYFLEFRYNQREECWYFSVSLTDGTSLADGVKVVCNESLLFSYAENRLPKGMLVAISNTLDSSPPKLLELGEGKRVSLIYVSESELG